MTLYRILYGRERPFDQTPEDRAAESSRLKTLGVVVGIISGIVVAIGGVIVMPEKISVAVSKSVQVQMDQRYVVKEDYAKSHKDLADATKKSDDDNRNQILGEMQALEGRMVHQFDVVNARLDTIRGETSYVNGILRGEKQPSYKPPPRNPQ